MTCDKASHPYCCGGELTDLALDLHLYQQAMIAYYSLKLLAPTDPRWFMGPATDDIASTYH